MTGPAYPADCSYEAATKNPEGDVRTNVSRSEIKGVGAGVWCPMNKGYAAYHQKGGHYKSAAAAQGAGMNYNHDHRWFYNKGASWQVGDYNEFVEVEFQDPVYILDLVVHSPRGYGMVVNIQAWNDEDGSWAQLWKGEAQKKMEAEYKENGWYSVKSFGKDVCKPTFAAKHFRVGIDTTAETGIDDWNYIDAIKLIGAADMT